MVGKKTLREKKKIALFKPTNHSFCLSQEHLVIICEFTGRKNMLLMRHVLKITKMNLLFYPAICVLFYVLPANFVNVDKSKTLL